MFTLYETAGVVTNLLAGLAGAKWGIKTTQCCGLILQLVGLGMLCGWQDSWDKTTSIVFVTFAQMMCGIAKDLVKLGGKAVTKLVTPDERQGALFSLVLYVTGYKNSMKGVGYVVGAAIISADPTSGFVWSLALNMVIIGFCLPWTLMCLTNELGTAKSKNVTLRQVIFTGNENLNWLSLACLFLFGSRDMWFEVHFPFYLRSPPCPLVHVACQDPAVVCPEGTFCGFPNSTFTGMGVEGGLRYYDKSSAVERFAGETCEMVNRRSGCGGLGMDMHVVGIVLALYIIIYGQMQAFTPLLVLGPLKQVRSINFVYKTVNR